MPGIGAGASVMVAIGAMRYHGISFSVTFTICALAALASVLLVVCISVRRRERD